MGRLRMLLVIAFGVLESGCWVRVNHPLDLSASPPDSSEFQVWSRDSAYVIHGLQVERDTLTGVRTETDAVRGSTIALSMAEVDSMRSVRSTVGRTFVVFLGSATIVMILLRLWGERGGT